jgi:heat shock protein HslJ/uncharacterized lipoprotein YbaY
MPSRFAACALLLAVLAWLAGCASTSPAADDGIGTIRGELASRTRIAVPYDAVAIVELVRTRDGRMVAEQRIALEGRQLPIAFQLPVHPAVVRAEDDHALRAAIHVNGRPAWVAEPLYVRAGRGPLVVGAMPMLPYEAAAVASALQCGTHSARVGMVRRGSSEVARLAVGGDRYELHRLPSASGVLYEAVDDASTQLWLQGERAQLTLRGERLPGCTVVMEAPDAVRARGNEPAWQIELGSELRFASGDLRLQGTAPPARTVGDARRYDGRVSGRIVNVTLAQRVCRDSMTGMPHPFAAEVIVDGRVFRGCGGEPETLLVGAEWVVDGIDGRMVERSRATLDFGVDGRLAGRATCNVFSAGFSVTGERLTIGPTAVTSSACAPDLMEQERRFLDILRGVLRFDVTDAGALVLEAERGRRITARRAPH